MADIPTPEPPPPNKTCPFPNCGAVLAETDKYYKEGFCLVHGDKAQEFLYFITHPAIVQHLSQVAARTFAAIQKAVSEQRQVQQVARSLIVPGRR